MKIKWTHGILVYLFWVITAGLGFLCLISARNLSLLVLYAFSASRWVAPVVDKMTFLILGILWLVLVILAEYYYRKAVTRIVLWKHFSLVTSIELFFLSGTHFIPILMISRTKFYWGILLLPTIELMGGIIFLIRRRK